MLFLIKSSKTSKNSPECYISGQCTPVEDLVTGGDIKEIWRDGSVPGHNLGAGYSVHPPCEKSLIELYHRICILF